MRPWLDTRRWFQRAGAPAGWAGSTNPPFRWPACRCCTGCSPRWPTPTPGCRGPRGAPAAHRGAAHGEEPAGAGPVAATAAGLALVRAGSVRRPARRRPALSHPGSGRAAAAGGRRRRLRRSGVRGRVGRPQWLCGIWRSEVYGPGSPSWRPGWPEPRYDPAHRGGDHSTPPPGCGPTDRSGTTATPSRTCSAPPSSPRPVGSAGIRPAAGLMSYRRPGTHRAAGPGAGPDGGAGVA